ncbi:MAG: outer rane biosis protein BamB, partial [Bacteroidetes bacterium]|nr:outer rane biosis protein BamB [Bacteroidota bacterium]
VTETTYRINLYFSELENKKPGERVFNIRLQNDTVLENFDIALESGKNNKEVIRSFAGIKAGKSLKLDLIPVAGNTILSGIELVQETVAVK